jgi:hypothetical protein
MLVGSYFGLEARISSFFDVSCGRVADHLQIPANKLLTKLRQSGLFHRTKPTESLRKINYLRFLTGLQNLHSRASKPASALRLSANAWGTLLGWAVSKPAFNLRVKLMHFQCGTESVIKGSGGRGQCKTRVLMRLGTSPAGITPMDWSVFVSIAETERAPELET